VSILGVPSPPGCLDKPAERVGKPTLREERALRPPRALGGAPCKRRCFRVTPPAIQRTRCNEDDLVEGRRERRVDALLVRAEAQAGEPDGGRQRARAGFEGERLSVLMVARGPARDGQDARAADRRLTRFRDEDAHALMSQVRHLDGRGEACPHTPGRAYPSRARHASRGRRASHSGP
jgi:hypothetical protein